MVWQGVSRPPLDKLMTQSHKEPEFHDYPCVVNPCTCIARHHKPKEPEEEWEKKRNEWRKQQCPQCLDYRPLVPGIHICQDNTYFSKRTFAEITEKCKSQGAREALESAIEQLEEKVEPSTGGDSFEVEVRVLRNGAYKDAISILQSNLKEKI